MNLSFEWLGKLLAFWVSRFLTSKIRVFVGMSKLPSISNTLLALWFSCILSPASRDESRSPLPSHSPLTLAGRSVQQAFSSLQLLLGQQAVEPRYPTPLRWSPTEFLNQHRTVLTQREGGWNWQSKSGCGRWPGSILDNQNEQRCSFHEGIKNKSKPRVAFGRTPSDPNLIQSHIPLFLPPWLGSLPQGGSEPPWVIICQALHLNITHPAQCKVQVTPQY